VSYETARRWSIKFGLAYAKTLRKTYPRADVRWHLDELFVSINGKSMYLWRAVDCEGEVLDVLVQSRRNKQAALKLMRKLLKSQGFCPTAVVTDKLPSYGAALSDLGMKARHITGGRMNNRAENRICRYGCENDACNVSSQPVQRRGFFQHMPRFTIPSTSSVI
jgi:putative transposase